MNRCNSCRTKAEARNGLCPVCGIVQDKSQRDLTSAEKKVRFHARGIRAVAMLHLIAAAATVFVMPEFEAFFPLAIFAAINAVLAYGLVRFSLIAYKAATAFYFFIGMVGVISIQAGAIYIGWILIALLALYLIGNGTSKAIFERQPI